VITMGTTSPTRIGLPFHARKAPSGSCTTLPPTCSASVNGKLQLDGPGEGWVTSRVEGSAPFTWHWPPRA